MKQRSLQRQIIAAAAFVLLIICLTFVSFFFANNVQEEVLIDLQDVVSRQRSINNVRRNLPDIHERMSNLSNLYMMEGHVGLEPNYLDALTKNINGVEQELEAILENAAQSSLEPSARQALERYEGLSLSWKTALEEFDSDPDLAVVELAIRAEPSSLELRSVVLPAIDEQNDALLKRAEEEYEDAANLERQIVLGSFALTLVVICAVFFRLSRTEQRRKAAQEGLDLMSMVMAQTDNGIIITNKSGQTQWVNNGFVQLSGYSLEDIQGQKPGHILQGSETEPEAVEAFREGLRGKKPFVVEVENYKKSGDSYWVRCSITPIFDEHNEIIQYVAIETNVTKERAQEEAILRSKERLQQAQKMEAIGRLAGGVAHDFNNLLSVLMISAEFLKDAVQDDEESLEDVKSILEAAQRGKQLTNQLLALSRRQPTQPKVLEPNTLIRDMQGLLQRLLGENIEFELHLEADTSAIRIDPTHLEQVTLNLVVNARDAMPEGGLLSISVANVRSYLGGDTAIPCVQILINDTGTGIPSDIIENIFEPFFSTKKEGQGTGLGLATVYGIIQKVGGEISVDSVVGEGTTFQLLFEAIDEPVEWPERLVLSQRKKVNLQGRSVLLVEDEFNVRVMVSRILKYAGVDVVTAEDPEKALQIMEELGDDWDFDLLLSDVIMPRGNGFSLARQISSEHPNTSVVLMTGYVDEETVPESELEDGWLLLRKPFSSQELLVALHSQLGLSDEIEISDVVSTF